MKKLLLIFFSLFLTFNLVHANQDELANPKNKTSPNFSLHKGQTQCKPITQSDLTRYSYGSSHTTAIALKVTGITFAVLGVVMVGFGIPLTYINAIGLGYASSDSFEVHYFDNNRNYGLAGFYAGISLIVTGSIFFIGGIIIATIGFIMGRTSKNASLYFEQKNRETAAIGIALKLGQPG